jgi:hypothetical protein
VNPLLIVSGGGRSCTKFELSWTNFKCVVILTDPVVSSIPGTKLSTRLCVQCVVNSLHNYTYSVRTVLCEIPGP